MSDAPLAGRTVVVTRSRDQTPRLSAALAASGATVVELHAIEIVDAADGGAALVAAAADLVHGRYGWVAVTSQNAVQRLVDALAALGDRPVPHSVRFAAVGSATAGALREAGIEPAVVPPEAVSDALVEAFGAPPDGSGPSRTVLFPRAERVRGALAEGLRAKGWEVDEVVAYRTVAGSPEPDAVATAHRVDAVAFTSSSTVERTVELLGRDGVPPTVVSIGPVTSATARAAGLTVAVEARDHTVDGLAAAVVDAFARTDGSARPRA